MFELIASQYSNNILLKNKDIHIAIGSAIGLAIVNIASKYISSISQYLYSKNNYSELTLDEKIKKLKYAIYMLEYNKSTYEFQEFISYSGLTSAEMINILLDLDISYLISMSEELTDFIVAKLDFTTKQVNELVNRSISHQGSKYLLGKLYDKYLYSNIQLPANLFASLNEHNEISKLLQQNKLNKDNIVECYKYALKTTSIETLEVITNSVSPEAINELKPIIIEHLNNSEIKDINTIDYMFKTYKFTQNELNDLCQEIKKEDGYKYITPIIKYTTINFNNIINLLINDSSFAWGKSQSEQRVVDTLLNNVTFNNKKIIKILDKIIKNNFSNYFFKELPNKESLKSLHKNIRLKYISVLENDPQLTFNLLHNYKFANNVKLEALKNAIRYESINAAAIIIKHVDIPQYLVKDIVKGIGGINFDWVSNEYVGHILKLAKSANITVAGIIIDDFFSEDIMIELQKRGIFTLLIDTDMKRLDINPKELTKEINRAKYNNTNQVIADRIYCSKEPNIAKIKQNIARLTQHVDGFWLTGGADIPSGFYVENDKIAGSDYNIKRSLIETLIIHEQQNSINHKPIMSTCRGNQMINVALGGTLKNVTDTYDDIKLNIGNNSIGPLSVGMSDNIKVNVHHHQALDKIAPGLKVMRTAVYEDGSVVPEATESTDPAKPLLLMQFHPEYRLDDNDNIALIDHTADLFHNEHNALCPNLAHEDNSVFRTIKLKQNMQSRA